MADKTWDAIVIGSGMGGLTCAAALAQFGHRILVLEQAPYAGGLTHTFERNGFRWDVGVHYLGAYGEDGTAQPILKWLSDGAIQMASVGPIYDTLHFPDGFEFVIPRTEAAFRAELRERFADSADRIDAYFEAMREAQTAAHQMFALRGMPAPLAAIQRALFGRRMRRWCGRTTQYVLDELFTDPKIKAVLSAQWGDYGGPPTQSSFGVHATIIREYFNGAYYPEGGAGSIAPALTQVIERAGGRVETNAAVAQLIHDGKAVCGVRLRDGREIRAPRTVSNVGALNTVLKLLPDSLLDSDWAREVRSFRPSVAHVSLYLGFEGDIAARGASRSNHWTYASWQPGECLWTDPANTDPTVSFISFPSLKDPRHDPGPKLKHTAEVAVFTDWRAFERFAGDATDEGHAEYQKFKAQLEQKVLGAFTRRFPALAPLIVHQEFATPFATVTFAGSHHGAFYGLETTPRRFLSPALNARTPIDGLYLSGQDVGTPGINGAMWGSLMTAGAIDSRVFSRL